jgi:hypothetical protein
MLFTLGWLGHGDAGTLLFGFEAHTQVYQCSHNGPPGRPTHLGRYNGVAASSVSNALKA